MPGIKDKKTLEPPGDDPAVESPDVDAVGVDIGELIDFGTDGEKVGLDDSEGFDEEEGAESPLFTLDIPEEPDGTEASEGDNAIPIEGIDDDDEYGWSDDGSPEPEQSWDPSDFDMPALTALGSDDGGEQGVEQGVEDDLTISRLPELVPGSPSDDELTEDLIVDDDLKIRFDVQLAAIGTRELPSAADEAVCQVSLIGPPCSVLSIDSPPPTLAGGAGIYGVEGRGVAALTALGAAGLDRSTVTSIVRSKQRIAVGLQPTGAMFSLDGGETFEPASASRVERSSNAGGGFYIYKGANADRLWGRTASGALMRSDDFGATWNGPLLLQRVVALTTSEDSVLAFSAGANVPSQLAITSDGGDRWSAARGPAFDSVERVYIAAHRGMVVLSAADDPRGPFLSRDRGKRWSRLPAMVATGPMALIREDDGVSLYTAHTTSASNTTAERVVVARHRPDGGESYIVLDVDEVAVSLGTSGSDPRTVYSMTAAVDGSCTELFVATSVGLFSVLIESALLGELM